MVYSAARWVQAYLIAQSVVANPDTLPIGSWPMYLDGLPDGSNAPNNALAIFDTVGKKQGRMMRTGQSVLFPGIMVHSRAVSRDDAYDKITSVLSAFEALLRAPVTIGSDSKTIQAISIKGNPMSLGELPGDVRRFGFSLNAIVSYT